MDAEQIKEVDVKIKVSICNACGGLVRAAVEHMMDLKMKNEFSREVMKHNLNVKSIPLLEYRETKFKWCGCYNNQKVKC